MASVWKARQISLDRIVAVKTLSSRFASDIDDVDRFQKEARAAARLKHSGIVQVHDANIENGVHYFVMEYVAGYTVGDWIRRKRQLSEDEALVVAECVADALGYAWTSAGIIHCDIKPDNVIIDADGTVKVADLGLARTMSAIGSDEAADEVMGTPAYISPEQAEGRPDLDCRADIYSLGAMLYHMVTGKLMFHGEAEEDVMEMQVTTDPVDPKVLNPDLSDAMHHLLSIMLAKDIADRPADWDAVRSELARVSRAIHGSMAEQGGPHAAHGKILVDHDQLAQLRRQAGQHQAAAHPGRIALVVAGLLLVAVLGVLLLRRRSPAGPPPVPVAEVVEEAQSAPVEPVHDQPEVPVVEQSREDDARAMFEFARRWVSEHPGEYREAMRRFARVAQQTRGTKYALMAEDELRGIRDERQRAVAEVNRQLLEAAEPLIAAGRFDDAARIYESYEGPHQRVTQEERLRQARELRERNRQANHDAAAAMDKSKSRLKVALDELASALTSQGIDAGCELATEWIDDPVLSPQRETMQELLTLLEKTKLIDGRILDSVRLQKGQTVTFEMVQGSRNLLVVDVVGDRIVCKELMSIGSGLASTEVTFGLEDLSQRERLQRMGSDSVPQVVLVKGLMAFRAKAYEHARRYFDAMGTVLAPVLIECVNKAEEASRSAGSTP